MTVYTTKTELKAASLTALLLALQLTAASAGAQTTSAADGAAQKDNSDVVTVIGKRVIKGSAGATGLDLSLRQTPQSVTVMDAQQIKDFGLDTANKVLANMTGIVVDAIETDRTEYNARGFDITNFQVDGVGQPLLWGTQFGDLDTAIFDRVEAIRGATGMMAGTGNPSATINYIRKRPTPLFHTELTASYGTWDDKRLTADISGPLNQSGTVEGRMVYAYEDKDSWLDYNHVNRNVYYGIVAWDITPKLKLTGGYSQQDNLADGVTWGGLPLTYSDGTAITSYEVSDTSSAPWTYWDNHDKTAFGELSYAFDNGWTAKVTATHRELDYSAKLLYAWGNPDAETGEDVLAYAGKYDAYAKESLIDAQASGPFSLFGREHQLVFGINTAQMETVEWESLAQSYDYYAPLPEWRSTYPADPGYENPYLAEDTLTKTTRIYGAAHLNFTDRLKGIVGFNAFQLKETGSSYEVSTDRSDEAISPYLGAVYDVTANISAYASYSDLHNPQYETDVDHKTLPAAVGKVYEAGLKSEWFGKRLYATAAVFKSDQHDLAEAIGTDPDTLQTYYAATEAYSKGYELEVAGRITPQWTLNGGWTDLSIRDGEGNDSRLYTPRRTLKLSSTYRIPQWRDLKFGAAVRWQSETSAVDSNTGGTVLQKAYAVTDLMASFRVASQVYASLNLNNVFDKQYWASLSQGQAYYAAPRSASFSLSYHY